jgi:phytoene dehydrogenase-like protein
MKRLFLLLLIVAVVAQVALVACGDDDDDNDDDGDDDATPNDDDDDNDTTDDDDTDVDAASSASPERDDSKLGGDHTGYNNAACFDCHNDAHLGGFKLGECATCHGPNGATPRTPGHADDNCLDCHADSHIGLVLESPKHCTACHKYVADVDCPFTYDVDAVVIGAGGGGLAAAAALQQAGLQTMLIERNYKVGGYMTRFHRGDYEFEASLHAIGGLEPTPERGGKGGYDDLSRLGVIDKLDPILCDPMYQAQFPGLVINVPYDQEAYKDKLKALFPDQSDGIDALFVEMRDDFELLDAVMRLAADFNTQDLMFILGKLPSAARLISYMFIDLKTMLLKFVDNEELIGIFTQLVTYVGEGPSRMQAVYFIAMWNSYHQEGFYYLTGGSAAITEGIADVFVEAGGQLKLNTLVTDIRVEGGLATQVVTENDACVNTRYVISNANAPDTLLKMVPADALPADYRQDVEQMEIGVATLQVFLGLDYDFADQFTDAHEIMVNESYDMDENFQWMKDGDVEHAAYIITNYTVVDPTTAPAGKNVISLTTYLPFDMNNNWMWDFGYSDYVDYKEEVAWVLIDRAELLLPGLSDHIEVLEVGSPVTNFAYSLNPGGTIFGFANTPEQGTLRRLPQQTPIDNLLLAGAWTFPGGGQSAVISSGTAAADMVLEKEAARK